MTSTGIKQAMVGFGDMSKRARGYGLLVRRRGEWDDSTLNDERSTFALLATAGARVTIVECILSTDIVREYERKENESEGALSYVIDHSKVGGCGSSHGRP